MSDFDPSPRSAKRRKTGAAYSTKVAANPSPSKSPSVLRSLSKAVSGISRRLFEAKDSRTLASEEIVDSAYGSKDESVGDGDDVTVENEDEVEQMQEAVKAGVATYPEAAESEDELADQEVSVTPVKRHNNRKSLSSAQKNSVTLKSSQRISSTEMARDENELMQELHETVTVITRSSGRERRRPRRYSNEITESGWSDLKHPTGTSTSSKQVQGCSRQSVVDEEGKRIEEQFGFKDPQSSTGTAKKVKLKVKDTISTGPRIQDLEIQPVHPQPHGVEDDVTQDPFTIEVESMQDEANLRKILTNTSPAFPPPSDREEDSQLSAIKSRVLSRLTSSRTVALSSLGTEYSKIHSLISATIAVGEGNSMLVLGSRGSGKTNLIETAIVDLSREHGQDFHVVRLNGFQQTDDKVALREIWRQLGREMQVDEDEMNQVSSYADTMASLLCLLSHPEELIESTKAATPATTTKSIVFILDEFDLFATHPRQTLLYNLFDIAQAKKAPIAVIGCCTRADVAESLEKRVKSRFSHRWTHLAQPKSLQAFEDVVRGALCLDQNDNDILDVVESRWLENWNEYIKTTFLLSNPIQTLLRQTYYATKSIPELFSSLYIPIASITSLGDTSYIPSSAALLRLPDDPLHVLPSLPHLHLSLLIAAARLDAIQNAPVVNFNLVYHHYVDLSSRLRLQSSASGAMAQGGLTKIWGRTVAKGAWEELGEWEIIVPAGAGKVKGDDALETRMGRVDVTLEEIGSSLAGLGSGAGEALARWCKEI